jgi:CheY-like chemotaxis protein
MVVDDNPGFLETASKVLGRGGLTVVGSAATSADALARVRETHPDVVLVDVLLGSESGLDLARRFEADSPGRSSDLDLRRDFADLITAARDRVSAPSRLSAGAVEGSSPVAAARISGDGGLARSVRRQRGLAVVVLF